MTLGQLIGSVDPFLFRPGDLELSPIPLVRAELAVLLVLGVGVLIATRRAGSGGPVPPSFAEWMLCAGATMGGWLLALAGLAPRTAIGPALVTLSSGAEMSIWLFTVYGLVAAVPLLWLLDRVLGAASSEAGGAPRGRRRRWVLPGPGAPSTTSSALVPLAAALAILAPGVVLTPTQLSPVLGTLYSDFGSVSSSDFALLACAGAHLPPGSRVLVAPGSAAEFLPGYDPEATLLYPLEPEWQWANGSYRTLVRDLPNGTLDPTLLTDLAVDFVAVTGNNTVLWPAFLPGPFLADPTAYPVVFHSGDAYLFSTTPGTPPFPCGG